MQGFKRRKACGNGNYQKSSTSAKTEKVVQNDLPRQKPLAQPAPDTTGNIKAEPEDQPLQPAQGTAGGIKVNPRDQPLEPAQGTAEGIRSNKLPARPRRAAAAAGIAKRIQSEADNAMYNSSAEPSRKDQTRKAPQSTAAQCKVTAAKHLKQHACSKAVEVEEVIGTDVKPRAAAKPRAKRAKRRRQGMQVYGLLHEPPADRMRMFGNFVGESPQRFIICGENPSSWDRTTQRCLPILVDRLFFQRAIHDCACVVLQPSSSLFLFH